MLSSKAKSFKRNAVNVSQNDPGSTEIIIEEDDPCKPNENPCGKKEVKPETYVVYTAGLDPRFQQQDQTLRCYVMYVDMNRCEQLVGKDHEACLWFQMVAKQICPRSWIQRWDELKEEGRFPWYRGGRFPNNTPYGK